MSMIGTRVVRKEDPALLTGAGRYVADIEQPDALHLVFVRSLLAHAQILEVDTSDAAAMPGVVGVYTAADLDVEPRPPGLPMLNQQMLRTDLAGDRARFVGEPIAAVVADTVTAAADAAELVFVDYEPLDVVLTVDEAIDGHTLLFPDAATNQVFAMPSIVDEADQATFFDDCEVVVELEFVNRRMAPAPIEPRAALARWDDGRLTQWSCTQFPHRTREGLAGALGVEPKDVRVITPEVGGGFGAKNGNYVEDFVVARVARLIDRPVRWAETRSESMLGIAHARDQMYRCSLGGTRSGVIQAYRYDVQQNSGAYPAIGAVLPMFGKIMACGPYRMPKIDFRAVSAVTNTVPVGAYRGAGRPEATEAIERMLDLFAAEIAMDPAEVRRRNLLPPDAFPHVTLTGADMDSGDYETSLDAVIEAADYAGLRTEQARRRDDPCAKLLGLGWTTYVEITNPMGASEFGSVEIQPDGSVVVLTGSSAHGQGHHTSFAQLVADLTGISFEHIEVRHGDTDEVARGGGTGGSRSMQVGGSAIWAATEEVVSEARGLAADVLEASVADIVHDPDTGTFSVSGSPSITVSWADVGEAAARRAEGVLIAEVDFAPSGPTFPFGTHLSVVEVDRDTGEVTILRHVACDDAGTIINPMLFEGQLHGGISSGIALGYLEEFVYDDDGNPQTANFMDYAIPAATEFPSFERIPMVTTTDRNPLGAKGVGEAGTVGATPAVQNAVIDAVAHLGVRHIEMPTTPRRVWQAMNAATRETATHG